MRFENVCDGKFLLARHLEININIGSRIENRSDAFVIVAEQIRKFCDTLRLDRFENERHSPELTRNGVEVQQDRYRSANLHFDWQQMINHVSAAIWIALHRLSAAA